MMLEEDEDEEVQITAINGLTDITIVYGDMKAAASQDGELGVSVSEIVEGLNLYIFHTVERLQSAACEAFCRLFMFDKVRSIPNLSNLLLLYACDGMWTVGCSILRQRNGCIFARSYRFSSPRIAIQRSTKTAGCWKRL